MNKQRRGQIEQARKLLEQASEILQEVQSDEQEAFDALPESLQQGDRGQAMESAISELEQAISYCEEINGFLDSASE